MSEPRPGERRDATKITDIRIRASNLGWMLETEKLDEADHEITMMQGLLRGLRYAVRERRRCR